MKKALKLLLGTLLVFSNTKIIYAEEITENEETQIAEESETPVAEEEIIETPAEEPVPAETIPEVQPEPEIPAEQEPESAEAEEQPSESANEESTEPAEEPVPEIEQPETEPDEPDEIAVEEEPSPSDSAEEDQPAETKNEDEISFSYSVYADEHWTEHAEKKTVYSENGIEAFILSFENAPEEFNISASILTEEGWTAPVQTGETAGSVSSQKKIHGISVSMSEYSADNYDLYYRIYCSESGWSVWTAAGNPVTAENNDIVQSIEFLFGLKGTLSPDNSNSPEFDGSEIRPDETAEEVTDAENETQETEEDPEESGEEETPAQPVTMQTSGHVQQVGWQNPVSGETNIIGTTGKSLRLEAFTLSLPEELKSSGNLQISAHVQNIGWMAPVGSDEIAGTVGRGLRLEAVKISLTGELADKYNIYYRAHVQNYGWMGWVSNGAIAGTTGCALRVEAIEVTIQPKEAGTDFISDDETGAVVHTSLLRAKGHSASVGWGGYVENGGTIGTTGKSLQMEALLIELAPELLAKGNISIQAHVQNKGWMAAAASGTVAGTVGQSLRLEGVKIALTGDLASQYDIYYRTHVEGIGWLPWTLNGLLAGSEGCVRAIESMQIDLQPKGSNAHETGTGYTTSVKNKKFTPYYYNQQNAAWSSARFGRWTFGQSGCVPTALAMAIRGVTGSAVTPLDVGNYLYSAGYFNAAVIGTVATGIPAAASHWGVSCYGLKTANGMKSALSTGKILVFAIGAGTFCPAGASHELVLFNYSGGNTYVYDPLHPERNGWYNVDSLFAQRSTDPDDSRGGYLVYALYH